MSGCSLFLSGTITFALADVPQADLERFSFSPGNSFLEVESIIAFNIPTVKIEERLTQFVSFSFESNKRPNQGGISFVCDVADAGYGNEEFKNAAVELKAKSDINEWVRRGFMSHQISDWIAVLGSCQDVCNKHFYEESFFCDQFRLRFVLKRVMELELVL